MSERVACVGGGEKNTPRTPKGEKRIPRGDAQGVPALITKKEVQNAQMTKKGGEHRKSSIRKKGDVSGHRKRKEGHSTSCN